MLYFTYSALELRRQGGYKLLKFVGTVASYEVRSCRSQDSMLKTKL